MAGACATGSRVEQAPDGGGPGPTTPDAREDETPDAPDVDPPRDAPPSPVAAGLLVTEVVLAPTAGELIEIANPTSQTIDLSTYYLADSGTYFRLPAGAPAVDANDFVVRFPAGATIGPGAVVTVAIDTAANFQTTYGVAPSFSIASGTMTSVAASGAATLTNGGEPVVLFQWDGTGDLVRDVDIVIVGVPSATNLLADKSGMAFDGPDAGSTTTAYATDARTITAQTSAPGTGLSTKRIALEDGFEVHAGAGNGITGDDETSEQTGSTWDSVFTAPTPGQLPAGLL